MGLSVCTKENPLHIRSATPADCTAIIALAQRIWRAHYPGIISPEQIDYMLAGRYTPEKLEELMATPAVAFYVAEYDGRLAGFMVLKEKDGMGAFLDQCYIDPSLQKKSIGSQLMQKAFSFAQKATLRLQVNRRNIAAINFYFKHGFTIERATQFDIGGGFVMDDFVMIREAGA